jgi:hypothetical protein
LYQDLHRGIGDPPSGDLGLGFDRTAIGAANMELVFITLLHKGSPVTGADARSVDVLKPIEDKILQGIS